MEIWGFALQLEQDQAQEIHLLLLMMVVQLPVQD